MEGREFFSTFVVSKKQNSLVKENMIDVKTIVKNATSACKRDGDPQIVYAYEDGDLAFTRLYSGLKLTDIKEVIGVVDGGCGKSGYNMFYTDDTSEVNLYIKSYRIKF